MKYYIISLALICGILTAPIENESVQEFLTGNRAFTANIYKQLIKQNPGNLLVSPLSLETVLALVYEGARGETADELMMGLSLPDSEQKIQTAFKSLLAQLQTSTDNLKLSSANKIYLGQGGIIEDPFKLIAEQVYSAGAENIDFSQTEAAADEINRWVEEQTDGRIQDLINPSSLDEDTKLVMVNSLYLSGQWKNPFDGYPMRRRNFHITKNEYVEIPLMSQQERFNYYLNKGLKAQFLELPLIGENISMVIVLPNEVDGLSSLEANIAEVLEPQKYDQEWVVVELPRFSTLSTTEFVPLLQNLGIRRIFGEGANLTGISSTYQDLYVSNVLQKTYINVTEGGIESAAATQVSGLKSTIPIVPQLVLFRANHPFLYYIQNNGVILFFGRYVEPQE